VSFYVPMIKSEAFRSNFESISANNRTLASHNFVKRKQLGVALVFPRCIFNSIQFKALFRVDQNYTYLYTSSNELLKSIYGPLIHS